MKDSLDKPEEKLSRLMTLFLIIGVLWLISIVFLIYKFETWQERAIFGDSFGAINSLFSGLAFGGIIYTILLQRNELKLQRNELILTREEIQRSAIAQEKTYLNHAEQLRISNIPIFQFETFRKGGERYLKIINGSTNDAFDVDIWLFLIVFEDDMTKEDFIKKLINKRDQHLFNNFSTNEDSYAVKDRGIYASFPKNNFIKILTEIPAPFYGIDVLIQFRDSLNNNYLQVINFLPSNVKSMPFVVSSFEPKVPNLIDRIDLTSPKYRDRKIPEFMKHISLLHKDSITNDFIIGKKSQDVEARWVMKNKKVNCA